MMATKEYHELKIRSTSLRRSNNNTEFDLQNKKQMAHFLWMYYLLCEQTKAEFGAELLQVHIFITVSTK